MKNIIRQLQIHVWLLLVVTSLFVTRFAMPSLAAPPNEAANVQNSGGVTSPAADTVSIRLAGGAYRYDQAWEILKLVNQAREKEGHQPLVMDKFLLDSAVIRAQESAVIFSHTRPNGTAFYTVNTQAQLENLAQAFSPELTVELWKQSSSHYAAMMSDTVKSAGVGCYYANGVIYTAMLFGNRDAELVRQPANSYVNPVVSVRKSSLSLKFQETGSIVMSNIKGLESHGKSMLLYVKAGDQNIPLISTQFKWESSNPSVVKVLQNGQLSYLKKGSSTIKATLITDPSVTISTSVICRKAKMTVKTLRKAYTFAGKAVKPKVAVYVNGQEIKAKNYKVSYSANKGPGTGKLTVTGKGNFKGLKAKTTFSISMKATNIKKATLEDTKLAVSWKKVAGVKGYQLQISPTAAFVKGAGQLFNVRSNTNKANVLARVADIAKFVRVRAWYKESGKKVYSDWSSPFTIKQ